MEPNTGHFIMQRDSPHVNQYSRSSRDLVAHILIILRNRMRRRHDSRGHPSNAFLHNSAKIWQVLRIIHVWKTRMSNDLVKFCLCAALNFRMYKHGLHKTDKDSGCGVTARFEERAGEVCSLFVRHVLIILDAQDVITKARLRFVTLVGDAGGMARSSSYLSCSIL
jgi:hypothetical protein